MALVRSVLKIQKLKNKGFQSPNNIYDNSIKMSSKARGRFNYLPTGQAGKLIIINTNPPLSSRTQRGI
jgi:hypothetical protein